MSGKVPEIDHDWRLASFIKALLLTSLLTYKQRYSKYSDLYRLFLPLRHQLANKFCCVLLAANVVVSLFITSVSATRLFKPWRDAVIMLKFLYLPGLHLTPTIGVIALASEFLTAFRRTKTRMIEP